MDSYKRFYNPEEEGFGDAGQWRNAFKYRMGLDAARSFVGSKNPRAILGVSLIPVYTLIAWNEIKFAYRKLVKTCHPDVCPNDPTASDRFKIVQGAYEILESEYKNRKVI